MIKKLLTGLANQPGCLYLIREHGEDAAIEAAMRADAMLEKGDLAIC